MDSIFGVVSFMKRTLEIINAIEDRFSLSKSLNTLGISEEELNSLLAHPPKDDSVDTLIELSDVVKWSCRLDSMPSNKATVLAVDKDAGVIHKRLVGSTEFFGFDDLYSVLYPVILHLKEHFDRSRPYHLSRSVCYIPSETHSGKKSYPSGHTAYAALLEKFLSEKHPNLSRPLNQATKQVGTTRILMGVHFQSDNDASIALVDKLWPLMKESKDAGR